MDIPTPTKHRRLVLWQLPIPKPPGMDPQLLPIQVAHLKHTMPSKERVCMVQTPPTCNQTSEPFLVPKQRATQGHIPTALEVPSHQEAVLQVGQDQPIMKREQGPLPQDCRGPPKNP